MTSDQLRRYARYLADTARSYEARVSGCPALKACWVALAADCRGRAERMRKQ